MDEDCDCPKVRNGDKRLNFILSENSFQELRQLARRGRMSLTTMIARSMGLAKALIEANEKGHKLVVIEGKGKRAKILQEIYLPKGRR